MKELIWNVYEYDTNSKKVRVYNIFDHYSFKNETIKNLKKYKDKEEFAARLRSSLMCYFWCKCEWEVVVSSWPCSIKQDELLNIIQEKEKHIKKFGREPYCYYISPIGGIKIDVFSQVINNWDVFLDYVWNSKNRKPRKEYGEWLFSGSGSGSWYCSKCSKTNLNITAKSHEEPMLSPGAKFCPNCGKPMRKKKAKQEVK